MARIALALALLAVAAVAQAQFTPIDTCPATLATQCDSCAAANFTKTECRKVGPAKNKTTVCTNKTETAYSCPTCKAGYQPSSYNKTCGSDNVSVTIQTCGPQCSATYGQQAQAGIPPTICAQCDVNTQVQLNGYANVQASWNGTSWVLSLKNATWTGADVVPVPASGSIKPFLCAPPVLPKLKKGVVPPPPPPTCPYLLSSGKCFNCALIAGAKPDATGTACITAAA